MRKTLSILFLFILFSMVSAQGGGGGPANPCRACFPNSNGHAGEFLQTNGVGGLSWQSVGAGSGWGLTGNAGTTGSNYLGTSDSNKLMIKTNGITRITINADGSRTDSYTGTNGAVLSTTFAASLYGASYGLGNYTYIGNLSILGRSDSSIFTRFKHILFQTYAGGNIDMKSANNVRIKMQNQFVVSAKNAVIVGNGDTIIAASSYTSNSIICSDSCHIDTGSDNSILASFKCAIRGVAANPYNNISHNLILGGYGDTTHSYHEIAIGPAAVANRSPYYSGGWDNRDLYLSMGNYGGITLSIDSEQSNLLIIKNGNMAIGSALRSTDIPTPSDAMLHVHGSLKVSDGTQSSGYVLTSDATGLASWAANAAPAISSGTVSPSSTPGKIGDMYIDTNTKKLYFATGTSSSADWTLAN